MHAFFFSLHQRILQKIALQFPQKHQAAQILSTLIKKNNNNNRAPNKPFKNPSITEQCQRHKALSLSF